MRIRVYDDAEQKVPFAELPDDWKCPLCGAAKSDFAPQIASLTTESGLKRLMTAVAKSERLVNEDILRESGYMLPQRKIHKLK